MRKVPTRIVKLRTRGLAGLSFDRDSTPEAEPV
jgi:hypothetical protein